MKKVNNIHFLMLLVAVTLTATLLSTSWFLYFWLYVVGVSTLVWFLRTKPENKLARLIANLF